MEQVTIDRGYLLKIAEKLITTPEIILQHANEIFEKDSDNIHSATNLGILIFCYRYKISTSSLGVSPDEALENQVIRQTFFKCVGDDEFINILNLGLETLRDRVKPFSENTSVVLNSNAVGEVASVLETTDDFVWENADVIFKKANTPIKGNNNNGIAIFCYLYGIQSPTLGVNPKGPMSLKEIHENTYLRVFQWKRIHQFLELGTKILKQRVKNLSS